jgi:hypothetical protein
MPSSQAHDAGGFQRTEYRTAAHRDLGGDLTITGDQISI